MSQTLFCVYITGEIWWSSTQYNWLMRGWGKGDQTALTRFCFRGIQENAQKEKSQNARSVRWTQSKISKHTTAHSTKKPVHINVHVLIISKWLFCHNLIGVLRTQQLSLLYLKPVIIQKSLVRLSTIFILCEMFEDLPWLQDTCWYIYKEAIVLYGHDWGYTLPAHYKPSAIEYTAEYTQSYIMCTSTCIMIIVHIKEDFLDSLVLKELLYSTS